MPSNLVILVVYLYSWPESRLTLTELSAAPHHAKRQSRIFSLLIYSTFMISSIWSAGYDMRNIIAVLKGVRHACADLSNGVGVALAIRPKRLSCFPQVVELYSAALSRGAEVPVVAQLQCTSNQHQVRPSMEACRCTNRLVYNAPSTFMLGVLVRSTGSLLARIYRNTQWVSPT